MQIYAIYDDWIPPAINLSTTDRIALKTSTQSAKFTTGPKTEASKCSICPVKRYAGVVLRSSNIFTFEIFFFYNYNFV